MSIWQTEKVSNNAFACITLNNCRRLIGKCNIHWQVFTHKIQDSQELCRDRRSNGRHGIHKHRYPVTHALIQRSEKERERESATKERREKARSERSVFFIWVHEHVWAGVSVNVLNAEHRYTNFRLGCELYALKKLNTSFVHRSAHFQF